MASFGVRALAAEEEAGRRAHGVICHDGPDLVRGQISAVNLPEDFPENIYVTFDLDGLTHRFCRPLAPPCPVDSGFIKRWIWCKAPGWASLCRH
jgi:agmatinase